MTTRTQLRASIATTRLLMKIALESKQRDLIGGVLSSMGGGESFPPKRNRVLSPVDEQAVKFEADHPKITGGVREVVDSLNKMGI